MNPQDQRTIEQLLEQMGADEAIGDPMHRYALRRTLLNSRYFEVHRARIVWERVIAISGPAFAGGFVVVMVAIAVHVGPGMLEESEEGASTFAESEIVEEELLVSSEQAEGELAGRSVLPAVDVIDIQNQPPVAHFVNFVNANMTPVMTQ